jgi:3-hydroxyisobutyrate dehydrogenase-like beta-hydroxyacid dehydrogenase
MRIGVLQPGQMGASVGAAAASRGHEVCWASEGRSAATAARAVAFVDVGSMAELTGRADVLLSIVPPDSALAVATAVAGYGYRGVYVDANAVAPRTSQRIGTVVSAAGASFVDGGIVGGPVGSPGGTRLYLAGGPLGTVASLFAGSGLEAVELAGPVGSASALKAAYAGWTKGTSALILAVRALARAEGVEEALLAEWQRSIPELPARADQAARSAASKGWRWAGEMDEIAAALAAHDLPAGFHQAAADVYRRVGPPAPAEPAEPPGSPETDGSPGAPGVDAVLDRIARSPS